MTAIAEEPLAFRCGAFSSPFSLLMPTFALPRGPPKLTLQLHPPQYALLPSSSTKVLLIHRFGDVLDARLLSMPAPLDQ